MKNRLAKPPSSTSIYSLPLFFAAMAQLVEQLPCKEKVRGSTPRGGTILTRAIPWWVLFERVAVQFRTPASY